MDDKASTDIVVQSDDRVLRELQELNRRLETLEKIEKARDDESKAKRQEEEERKLSGELTAEEKTLDVLEKIQSGILPLTELSETEKQSIDYLAKLQELLEKNQELLEKNQEETVSEKNLNELVKVVQKDYEQIEMTSRIVNSYGLVFIPVVVILLVLYNLLKDFI